MRRILAIAALLWAAWTPGHAATVAQKIAAGGNPCVSISISLAFGNNGAECYNDSRAGPPASIPGWSFTGGTATNGIVDADCSGLPVAWASGTPRIMCNGLSIFQAATNSFLNSAAGVTQNVTTTAASWTLSFWGTGSIVETGTCSGTLNGSSATIRVTLTVTATAGTCTLTVTGTATNVQFEAGAFATPVAVTIGSPVTRTVDVAKVTGNFLGSGSWAFLIDVTGVAASASSQRLAAITDGTTSNDLNFYRIGASNTLDGKLQQSNTTKFDNPIGTMATGAAKTVMALVGANVHYSLNGGAAGNLGAWTAFTPSQLDIGSQASGNSTMNGYMRRVTIWTRAFSDSQLKLVTQ
jgi:hypothetical protein